MTIQQMNATSPLSRLRVALPLALWVALLAGSTPLAQAAEERVEALPIAVNVEGRKVASSMVFELPVERYGEASNSELRTKSLDPVEQSYIALLEALAANDVNKAARSLAVADSRAAAQRVETLRGAFGGMESPRSIARMDLGARQLFVWDWESPKGPMRRGFAFDVESRKGRLTGSSEPLPTLLVDILQNQVEEPQAFAPKSKASKRFAYRLPLAGDADVIWRFDGEPLDFDLYGGEMSKNLALAAVQAAHAALEVDDIETFLAAYTPESSDKLRGWIEAMTAQEYESFKATSLLPKRAVFVLDADPVHLVFYHFDLGTSAQQPMVSWLYVVRDAKGDLKLANAYREAFLDDFLKDESLVPRDPSVFRNDVLGLAP